MNTNEIENSKKNSNSLKTVFLVIVVVGIISLIGFAFARYITQLNGNTEAQIARWDFKVTAGSSQNLNIDLSQTRYANDTNEVNREKVAPGTSGALVLNVDATNSQVSLKYDIDITQIPENLIFYSDSNMTNAMYKEDGIIHLEGFFDQGANSKTEARTLYWQWPIETGSTQNEIDINDLLDSNWVGTQPEISIQVTGRQVMQEQQTNKYAVTFDANGGTLEGYGNASQTTKMVTYGETYGALPTPSREGYTFKGWNGKNLIDINKGELQCASIIDSKLMLDASSIEQNLTDRFIQVQEIQNYSFVEKLYSGVELGNKTKVFEKTSNFNRLKIKINTTKKDALIYINVDGLENRASYTLSFNVEYIDSNLPKATISNIQIEKGSTATAYEPYYITSSTEVVQNQNHTLTAIWEPKSN